MFEPFVLSLFFFFFHKWVVEEAALCSGGLAVETSVSFGRWQQGEQTVAGVGIKLLSWALYRHLALFIFLMLCR